MGRLGDDDVQTQRGGRKKECGRPKVWIERTAFPGFDGNQENWAEFRQVFQELMKASEKRGVLELAQHINKFLEETNDRSHEPNRSMETLKQDVQR